MKKTNIESLGKVISTDILIIGGGLAGISAAITAKETDPTLDILVVDKAVASKGYAGKSGRTAGLLSFVTEKDDPEDFVKYSLNEIGIYLNDQILLREFAYSSKCIAERLTDWGVDVPRDETGRIDYAKWPFPWGTASVDPYMCLSMSKYAKKQGINFLDRIAVIDLLKDGEHVAGAIGFSMENGGCHIFQAKAVILANGSQNYDVTLIWCATGNGIATAWRAGAEMRNAEFGNMCDFARVDPQGWLYYGVHGGAHIAHDHLRNANGENVSEKYRPGLHSSMDPIAALAWYKEVLAGKGPISVDVSIFSQPPFFKFHPAALDQMHREAVKANFPENQSYNVVPGFIGELSCVKVDHQMATTVPGLFAAGDIAGMGSARGGAVPTPPAKIHGMGILNALFMGTRSGPSAAIHARALKACGVKAKVDFDHVGESKTRIYAPLDRRDGLSHWEVIPRIQDVIAPVDYSLIKTEERMKEALDEILRIQLEVGKLKAKDYHELTRCIDVQSMVLCAEMFYKASLMRKESRGFHLREDFPAMDNKNWLKWINLRNTSGTMELYTEDIPFEKYPYKPPKWVHGESIETWKGRNVVVGEETKPDSMER
jgi:succinate dehydrogenase/fumarate reductase flavoprotein subunit